MSLMVVLPPAVAAAPLRTPEEQVRLAALAEALGRAHALHRLCAGPQDNLWRAPMQRLLAVEHATPALCDRLTLRFNAGYAGVRARRCGPQARSELAAAAAEGRDLARGLRARPAGAAP